MKLKNKIENAKTNTWLTDALSEEERLASEIIALISVSIQKQRRNLGLTQKQLADKLGVSQAMVSQWENGDENFTIATLVKISSALGLSLRNPISV